MNKFVFLLCFACGLFAYEGSSLFEKSYEEPWHEQIQKYEIEQLLRKDFSSLEQDLSQDYSAQDFDVANLLQTMQTKERKLLDDSLYMQVGMISIIALLYVAPESVSKWSDEQKDLNNVDKKWLDNVKAGPVVDEDEFVINYVGHPVSGATYYALARNNGYGPFGSFMYSFFISTFIWEYGYESIAEVPSIQDLISTPLVGSLMGEGMYYLEQELDKNGGFIFGSRILGNIGYAFLNPLGRLKESLEFDGETTLRFQTYQGPSMSVYSELHNLALRPSQHQIQNYGVVLRVEF